MNLSFVLDTLKIYTCVIKPNLPASCCRGRRGKLSVLTVGFDYSERLRGDSAAQSAWATSGRNGGWLSANDVRRSQGLNEGGPELDVYMTPLNYINANICLSPRPLRRQKRL